MDWFQFSVFINCLNSMENGLTVGHINIPTIQPYKEILPIIYKVKLNIVFQYAQKWRLRYDKTKVQLLYLEIKTIS